MAIIKGKGNTPRPDVLTTTSPTPPVGTQLPASDVASEVDNGKDFVKAGETATPPSGR